MQKIYCSGFDVWIVGGAIRDFLAGYPPHDWDLATNAPSQNLVRLFPRVVPIGIPHGTVQINTGERTVEVNSYLGSGKEGILADLGRRDFTVNALAAAHPGGEILDPYGGEADLRAGILRSVGDGRARFQEDALRTLRAGRFVSTYDWTIEANTFDALRSSSNRIQFVAKERLREELFKLLCGTNIIRAFDSMRVGGVLKEILPEMLEHHPQESGTSERLSYDHLVRTVQLCPKRLRLRLAALFHDIAKPALIVQHQGAIDQSEHLQISSAKALEILTRLKVSRKLTQEVVKLIERQISNEAHDWSDAQIRHIMSEVGIELLDDLLDLAYADRAASRAPAVQLEEIQLLRLRAQSQLRASPPLQIRDLAINGNDLMRVLGLSPGPLLGEILADLHKVVLTDPTLNHSSYLLEHAMEKLLTMCH